MSTHPESPPRRLTEHERYVLGAVCAMFGEAFPGEPETAEGFASALRIVKTCERSVMQLTTLVREPPAGRS